MFDIQFLKTDLPNGGIMGALSVTVGDTTKMVEMMLDKEPTADDVAAMLNILATTLKPGRVIIAGLTVPSERIYITPA